MTTGVVSDPYSAGICCLACVWVAYTHALSATLVMEPLWEAAYTLAALVVVTFLQAFCAEMLAERWRKLQ